VTAGYCGYCGENKDCGRIVADRRPRYKRGYFFNAFAGSVDHGLVMISIRILEEVMFLSV